MKLKSLPCCSILTAGLLALAGCGSAESNLDRVPVQGTVHLDGQPLPKGSISFVPQEPTFGPRSSGIIQNGEFRLTSKNGPVPGSHRVEILADQSIALEDPAVAAKLPGHTPPPNPVGRRYNEKSELTATISFDSEPLHFDVKGPG